MLIFINGMMNLIQGNLYQMYAHILVNLSQRHKIKETQKHRDTETTPNELFERTVAALEEAGVQVKRVPLLDDVDELSWAHLSVMRYEAAVANPGVHGTNGWWRDYAGLYRARTAELITKGLHTSEEDYAAGLAQRETLRTTLASTAAEHCIDFWLTPGAPGACATLACSRAFADAQGACPQAPRPAA